MPGQGAPPAGGESEYRLSDGTAYSGPVFEQESGGLFGEMFICCWKCGGNGRWRGKLACNACDGGGGKDDQVRVYDQNGFARPPSSPNSTPTGPSASTSSPRRKPSAARSSRTSSPGGVCGGLTEKQHKAVARVLANTALLGNSAPVGAEGERGEVSVCCVGSGSFFREEFKARKGKRKQMQEVFVTDMADEAGNAYACLSASFNLAFGDRAELRGAVKDHDDRVGWTDTPIKNVFVVSLVPAPSPSAVEADPCEAVGAEEDGPSFGM
jgi:hypothetical protein